ncbi:hypothetical protein D9757_013693 [Collybiopsis confluens]|uniref:Uncharacterized protein n=1 Tax=Collybiopsis confluens TaxID=2823264 RepID=A0A8H5GN66_9AGAR|nr:hypothetical protein D9757_013693 [Collybiopsis confluens]
MRQPWNPWPPNDGQCDRYDYYRLDEGCWRMEGCVGDLCNFQKTDEERKSSSGASGCLLNTEEVKGFPQATSSFPYTQSPLCHRLLFLLLQLPPPLPPSSTPSAFTAPIVVIRQPQWPSPSLSIRTATAFTINIHALHTSHAVPSTSYLLPYPSLVPA